MHIEMTEVTAGEFFAGIHTNTLIEERIQLMLGDDNVGVITFNNGKLSSGKVAGELNEIHSWALSLEETLQVTMTICDKLAIENEIATPLLNGYVHFKDVQMEFSNLEEDSISNLDERLANSRFLIQLFKLDKVTVDNVTEDMLPF